MRIYNANVLFEASIDVGGSSYLTIFGKHINGYFCAIPNVGICCEMAEARDTFYNFERLLGAGIKEKTAKELACTIYQITQVQAKEQASSCPNPQNEDKEQGE